MGYSVSFTGVDIDNILSKSQKFKSQNEDWVLIPSTITTLDISTLIRNGNYAFHGTLNLPEMDQLYGYNTTSKQEAKSLEGSCLIFVRNINRTIYQFISFYGIQDVTDQTIGIAWIHKVPKIFHLNESSNILFSYAENELNDKGIAKFDRQIRLFNDTGEFKYYDESEKSYKMLTGIISEMPKTIYGDLTNAFTKIDESLSTYEYVLDHINDDMIHVTSEEKENYNSKYNRNLLNNEFDSIFPTLDTLQSNVSNLITENETVINSAVSASTPISKDLNMHTPGWNLIESVPGIDWYSVCYGEDKFLAAGCNSNDDTGSLIYSEDGIHWNDCVSDKGDLTTVPWSFVYYGNGLYFAGSFQASLPGIFKSTDGIHWNLIRIGDTSKRWSSVCYGNDKFVVVAYNSNYFAYSTDGITWTESIISSTNRNWWSVCYGNGKFVAVDLNSSYFAYSTDGINWTESTISSTSKNWSSVCYGNDKFVAVAFTSNYFAYSTDGINWTENIINESYSFTGITFCNNQFVATGLKNNNGVLIILYSTDAINWSISSTTYIGYQSPSICYGNGKYITGIINFDDFSSKILYSDNLISWNKTNESRNIDYNWQSICYGNGKFVVISGGNTSSNYFAYSTDGMNWTEGTISSTNRNWASVCYGNDKFVTVANNSNYFAYSTDGIHWTEGTISSTKRYWYSVCYGNGKFVAISGNNGSSSNINGKYFAYSTNGINWTESTISDTSRDWHSVCYGNDKFVTVANSNSNYFAYSINGINWTEGTISSTSRYWYSVCYGNGKFVAVASSSKYFAYSTDGINWTEGMISDTNRNWYSVCYGNGKFVAIARSSNYFAYSTDGINWTEGTISSTSKTWQSVCYGNDKFVVVANGNIAYEYDYAIPDPEPARLTQIMEEEVFSVCYGNNTFVAIGLRGTAAYSTDGTTWTQATISKTSGPWSSVCYGNGKFVAICGYIFAEQSSNAFAYSTDGINWTEGTISETSRNWNSICYGNDKFVAVADSGYFAYSSDGINWTEGIISETGEIMLAVCYGNGKFVAIGVNMGTQNGYFAYSTDGIHWTEGSMSSNGVIWLSACYGNNTFVVVGGNSDSGYGCYAYSTDGINWTGDVLEGPGIFSICYGNDKFVAVAGGLFGPSKIYYYSTDGINWSISNLKSSEKQWVSSCYGNDRFIIVSIEGACTYLTNEDFVETVELLHPTMDHIDYWNDKAEKGHTHILDNRVIVDASDVIGNITIDQIPEEAKERMITVNSISDMLKLTKKDVHEGTWVFVTERNTSKLFVVKDLTTWTEKTLPSSRKWTSICYGNGKFVAVAYKSNYYAYSTNGINWTQRSIGYTRDWWSVCYGNGKFVAVASYDKYFAYSSNGTSWTRGTLPSSRGWNSVCYGNDKFVVVAGSNSYFAYSTDGINWTEGMISSTSRAWESVCYGNGKFVVVAGSNSYFAYSTDGINWTESTISSTIRGWRSVCYGNGKFVTVAYSSNYFAYSTDGINWTEGTISETSRYWNSICYGNGKFVAVADGTNYFAYSTDGINWTEGTISDTSRNWRSVCYGNGKFVTVAYNTNYFAYGNPISLDNFTQLTYIPDVTWDDVTNKPTTFDELGITDSISNTEVDTLVSNLPTPTASAQTAVDNLSTEYSILTTELIVNNHKIETDIDDSDQKLNTLYDILTIPDEIVTTLKSLMT